MIVVLGVITLGGTTLLASLARAREAERSAMCLMNLGRLGEAISAYVADNDNYLPGPIHIGFPYDAGEKCLSGGPQGPRWYSIQPAAYLNSYVKGRAGDPRTVDTLAHCPTSDGIPVASSTGQPFYYQPRLYYVANTGGIGTETPGLTPYYVTDPPNYFGAVNLGPVPPWDHPPELLPKQLDTIDNLSQEWAVADLWYWEAAPPRGTPRVVGTWPYTVLPETSGSVVNNGELKIPSYPFHNTAKTFSPHGDDHSTFSPRLTTGMTNAVFFDAHAEGVRGWTGSVNPPFGAATGDVEK